MMQIYLCEDIKIHAEELENVLKSCAAECNVVAEIKSFDNAEELLENLRCKKESGVTLPLLLFCDIEMPGMSGIELGKILKDEMPEVCLIFMTAYSEYAIEGYETGAYRYLLKPPSKDQITKIMFEVIHRNRDTKRIMIKNAKEEMCIGIRDILYVSAEDKYLVVHTKENEYLTRGSLQDYEDELKDFGFWRVHRKYLINLRYHKSMTESKITLSNDEVIPLSRRNEANYRKAFIRYLEGGLLK